LITPNAEINDGELDLFLCKKLSVTQRFKYLPVLKSGKHTGLSFTTLRRGKSFQIEADKELAIQIDGELHFAQKVQIDILPKQFYFRY
jgi:diacylglycerol kinase (ATP)